MKSKKLIVTLAITAPLTLSSTLNINATYLKDISNHWAKKPIQQFVNQGYVFGYDDNTFKPDNNITRAEFVSIMNRYFKISGTSGKVFKDTKSHWAKKEIDIAYTNGIVNGISSTHFKPDAYISREEVCVMLANYLDIQNTHYNSLWTMNDPAKVSSWAKSSVEGVLDNKYMFGSNGNVNPQSNTTRAEAVAILSRVKEKVVESNNKPVLTIANPNLTLKQGTDISVHSFGVKATDKEDGDVIHTAKLTGNYDKNKAGKYTLTITVNDSKGNKVSKQVTVTVKEKEVFTIETAEFNNKVNAEFLRLVNAERAKWDRKPVKTGSEFVQSAEFWSKHMVENKFFDHEDSSGKRVNDYVVHGGGCKNFLENIGGVFVNVHAYPEGYSIDKVAIDVANQLFVLWQKSPGHLGAMINEEATHIGLGVHVEVRSDGSLSGAATMSGGGYY